MYVCMSGVVNIVICIEIQLVHSIFKSINMSKQIYYYNEFIFTITHIICFIIAYAFLSVFINTYIYICIYLLKMLTVGSYSLGQPAHLRPAFVELIASIHFILCFSGFG